MKNRPAAVAFIFVTVTLDMLSIGLIAPVLPKLVLDFVGGDTSTAARWLGIFGTVFATMQFFFSPVLGVLSDRFGRRPIILLSNLGLGLDYVVMALSPTLGWLFVGRVISGITSASIATAMAYIADTVPKEKRAGAFGMIGAAFGAGFILGPALGGVLGNANPRLPFWVASALSLTNFLYGLFIVPESLPPERRRPFLLRRANPVGALVLLRSQAGLLRLGLIQFLGYLANQVFGIWALYGFYQFAWKESDVGLSLAVVGFCTIAFSAGLVKPVVKRLGERRTVYTGQFFGALGLLLAGLARTGGLFLCAIPVISIWNISGPAAQGLMTHRVSEKEQGELQGAISSLRSLAVLCGPLLFSFTFAWFVDPKNGLLLPAAPWYLAAGLLFGAMFLATRLPDSPPATP